MAYAEHNISSLADIPTLAINFAVNLGWHLSGPLTIQHPNYEGSGPGGMSFQLMAEVDDPIKHLLIWQPDNPMASAAAIRSPVFSTMALPLADLVQLPSKLFLIGMMEPEPYIAIVIEYGYNLYRHLYLGFMEKIGNYSGGEVISGNAGMETKGPAYPLYYRKDGGQRLFSGYQHTRNQMMCGGVHVEHAQNISAWRNFYVLAGTPSTGGIEKQLFDGSEAIGGFGDSINDGFVARGKNTFAGTSVLSPINLYATQMVTDNAARFRPIGRPTGVRHINIEELEAQATVSIVDETWHTFAALRKGNSSQFTKPFSGFSWPLNDISFYLGYAYRSA